jgi:hypothetical protein
MRIDLTFEKISEKTILYPDEIDYTVVDLTGSEDDFLTEGNTDEAIATHLRNLIERPILIECGPRSVVEGKLMACNFRNDNFKPFWR